MRFKNILLDYITIGLSLLALIFDIVGLFAGPWWTHTGHVGQSLFGITAHRVCQFSCVDKTVLVIEGGKEFILTVRGFEVLGLIFMLIGTILTVLAVTVRTRSIHTAIVYIHGAAAIFIVFGVFIFLGYHTQLGRGLEGAGSIQFPFALTLLAGIMCIVTSVVSGLTLRKHLVTWTDDEDEDEQEIM